MFALGLHFSPFKWGWGGESSYVSEMLEGVNERMDEKSSLEAAKFCDLGGTCPVAGF